MKKLIASLAFIAMAATTASSQSGLGIKAGFNLSSISTNAGSLGNNIKQSYATRTGLVAGVYGRLGNKTFLQPELLIASKGGEVEVVNAGGVSEFIKAKYTDLDIPVLIGFQPINSVYILGGPVASLNLSQDKALKDALKEYADNPKDAFAKSSFGYQVGVGLKLRGINLDLRRQGSLSSISALNLPNEPKFSQRATGWQLTAGIKIL